MLMIGCDFHTRYQQIAMLDTLTGEVSERRLEHESGEAQDFYRSLQGPVRVGIEATGPIHWFARLLGELGGVPHPSGARVGRLPSGSSFHAEAIEALLRAGPSPFHHLQLLSPFAAAGPSEVDLTGCRLQKRKAAGTLIVPAAFRTRPPVSGRC